MKGLFNSKTDLVFIWRFETYGIPYELTNWGDGNDYSGMKWLPAFDAHVYLLLRLGVYMRMGLNVVVDKLIVTSD